MRKKKVFVTVYPGNCGVAIYELGGPDAGQVYVSKAELEELIETLMAAQVRMKGE